MPGLIIDLVAIPEGGHELAVAVPSTAFSLESSEVYLRDPVALRARISRVGTTVAVHGALAATAEVPCVRCLEPAVISIEETIDVVVLPESERPEEEDHELAAGEMDLYYYSGDKVDLRAIVWDHLAVVVPIQPICSPDCRGLCPSCGAKLGVGACDCASKEVDDRFSILKEWQARHQRE